MGASIQSRSHTESPGAPSTKVIDFTVTVLIAEVRTAPRRPELLIPTQGISIVLAVIECPLSTKHCTALSPYLT